MRTKKPLTIKQLSHRGHRAWSAGDFAASASLFLQAAALFVPAIAVGGVRSAPDKGLVYRVRAGYCFARLGQWTQARPLLWEAASFDWQEGPMWNDRYDGLNAMCFLLKDAAESDDWTAFAKRWELALEISERLRLHFPVSVGKDQMMLEIAVKHGLKEQCRYLVPEIIRMRNLPRRAKRLAQIQALITQAQRII